MVAVAAPARAKALLEHQDLARILALLDRDGEEARVVGGAVRNSLLGRPVTEIDIATTATPEIVMARAQAAKLKSVPTGLAHGTIMLLVESKPFEVTSLREDIETDGRHAKVKFSRDFAVDARRRDFTINALSLSRDGMLYDYVGGLADIEARRLRFIGDPVARIREDYLRILRFFRFAAAYGEGPLDGPAVLACLREREGLARLSRERVRSEILKLLAAPRAGEVTREFSETGLLGTLLSSAPNPARLINLLRFSADEPRDSLLALAALCVNLPEDAERLREGLRLSNSESQRLAEAAAAFLSLHGIEAPPVAAALLRLIFRYGRQAAGDALALAAAERGGGAAWREALAFVRAAPELRLPFSGADLIARGVPDGKEIGEALKELRKRWIEAGFPQDREKLQALLDAVVAARLKH
ncbi:MAG TPA: CCA tRNA nucleotidyltransferase [Methylovirgula sp.]|nr:CCA tRNA nucleotidyltransferase [Methylovirgula sp.]